MKLIGTFRIAGGLDVGAGLAGTAKPSQADITTAAAYTFADRMRPDLKLRRRVPQLARFVERCEAMPAFQAVPLPA